MGRIVEQLKYNVLFYFACQFKSFRAQIFFLKRVSYFWLSERKLSELYRYLQLQLPIVQR